MLIGWQTSGSKPHNGESGAERVPATVQQQLVKFCVGSGERRVFGREANKLPVSSIQVHPSVTVMVCV